jgi:hypothetical protein
VYEIYFGNFEVARLTLEVTDDFPTGPGNLVLKDGTWAKEIVLKKRRAIWESSFGANPSRAPLNSLGIYRVLGLCSDMIRFREHRGTLAASQTAWKSTQKTAEIVAYLKSFSGGADFAILIEIRIAKIVVRFGNTVVSGEGWRGGYNSNGSSFVLAGAASTVGGPAGSWVWRFHATGLCNDIWRHLSVVGVGRRATHYYAVQRNSR